MYFTFQDTSKTDDIKFYPTHEPLKLPTRLYPMVKKVAENKNSILTFTKERYNRKLIQNLIEREKKYEKLFPDGKYEVKWYDMGVYPIVENYRYWGLQLLKGLKNMIPRALLMDSIRNYKRHLKLFKVKWRGRKYYIYKGKFLFH